MPYTSQGWCTEEDVREILRDMDMLPEQHEPEHEWGDLPDDIEPDDHSE